MTRNGVGICLCACGDCTCSKDIHLFELIAIKLGLQQVLERNISRTHIESDDATTVDILLRKSDPPRSLINITRCIFDLLRSFYNFRISHIFHEGNECVDWLAKYAFSTKTVFLWTDHWPDPLPSFLHANVISTGCIRLIT